MSGQRRVWLCLGFLCGALGAWWYWHSKPAQPSDDSPVVGPVTFSHDVAPIVFAKCASCHHPGEAAPFSLLTYDDVRHRAKQIADVTQRRFMPPWLPTEGHFADARKLSPRELQVLKVWSESGAALGDQKEVPAPPQFPDPWQTNPPDLVLETPAYSLAGQERDVFRNFVVPLKLDGPRWIKSIELRPTNPRVTHHARVGVDSSNESLRRDAEDEEPGYAGMSWGQDPDGQLVVWAPGMAINLGTEGVAWRLFPNTCLVLHTHMQPSGKPEVAKFRVGIRFAKDPPKQHPAILRIGSCDIDIPAGARRHVVTDEYTLPIDVDVHTIFPHAHSLCTDLQVVAEWPDSSRTPLISIEHFDENWHDSYRYQQPVRLPRGTRLRSTFAYDNTDGSIRNRNRPARRVVYGSNVNDEMAEVYLQVTPVHSDQRAVLMEDFRRYQLQSQVTGYLRSREVYPDDPWIQERLATCYYGLGQPAKAITLLEQRLNTGEKAVYPLVSLGMAFLVSGEAVKAEAHQRDAIALDEKYPLAWFALGKALVAQRKPNDAEQAFRRAIDLAPGLLEARLNLADLLIQRGDLDQAKEICSAVLADSPDMSPIYLKLAEISVHRRKYDEGLAYCQMAQRLAPYTHPPKALLAIYCVSSGDEERCLKLLREAHNESPTHPVPLLYLGQFLRRQQEWKQAREHLQRAMILPMPDNWPQSHKQRFQANLQSERLQLAQQIQDMDLARDAISQWLKSEPNNPRLRKMHDELNAKKITP